ncbi:MULTISPECIES: sulfatase-like hydrolase/transferase [Paenibacillus]|uniref:sulfatase-like hydrolase/transferase n=1 Tax=Paenibacillus TaxID=44249 RepID=UPI0002DB0180
MRKTGPHSASDINMYANRTNPEYPRHPGEIRNKEELRFMIDGYDCGVRHMDERIGSIFKPLEEKGVMDDLVVIITAGHGENMGELGIYGEHGTSDQATCRIPMIIRWPGMTHGTSDSGLHYHLDLLPTMAETIWLYPSARMYASGAFDSKIGCICGRTYHDGYHLFDKEMLFNLKDDPFEQRNLAAEMPHVCKDAIYILNDWHDEMMSSMKYDVDPLWTVMKEGGAYHAKGNLPRYLERLKESGRSDAVPELIRRHPIELTR